jgi:hypothetical protein
MEFVGERQAYGKRQSAPDNCVSPVEASVRVKEVHRAAAAHTAALELAVHLGHHRAHTQPLGQGVTVFAVGSDYCIVLAEVSHHPHGDGFLADVQVKKTANLALRIDLGAALFEATNLEHPLENLARFVGLVAFQSS